MPAPRLTDRAWAILILGLTLPVMLRAVRPEHHWGGDFAVYVSQARNIVEGRPLYESTYAVTPESALHHPAAYPPLPSLVIAPIIVARGLDYRAMKWSLALFAWLSFPVWFLVGRRLGLSPGLSGGAVLAFSCGAILFPLLDTVGSDSVYLFVSAAALLAFLWIEEANFTARHPFAAAAVVSALLLGAAATRSAGLALVLAWGGHEAIRAWKRKTVPAYTLWTALLLGTGLLAYQTLLYDTAGQYGNQFSLEPALLARNATYYLRLAAPLWSNLTAPLRYALATTVLLCGLIGWALRARRGGVVELYGLASVAMVWVYTVNNDFRYTVPLLPLLLFWSLQALSVLGLRLLPPRPALPARMFAGACVAASSWNLPFMETGPVTEGVAKPAFQEAVDFLRSIPTDTLVVSWNPRVIALYTRRPSALYPATDPFAAGIPPSEHAVLVTYSGATDTAFVEPYLATHPLPVVYRNSAFTVYRLR